MSEAVRSSNSSEAVSLLQKMRYSYGLLRMRMADGNDPLDRVKERIREVRMVIDEFERVTGKKACESSVVEIGFGARPERAFAFSAFFRTVHAIDLDAPVLSVADLPRVYRRNGFERGLKSTARHLLFDRGAWPRFHAAMARQLAGYDPAKTKLVVGNAGDAATWKDVPAPDLVVSFDVFEHIPPTDLKALMIQLHAQMAPNGLIYTRPMVFTGIAGGHDLEWYPHRVKGNESDTAWGHVIDPEFRTNTYVNKLKRSDYRQIFEEAGFETMRDEALEPDFGRQHMTPERRATLAGWDDYELFSNWVAFELRRRA